MSYPAKVDSPESLGLALQQSRLAAGITQRDLAARLGTTQKYIWELESGRQSLLVTRLFALLNETGATMIVNVPEGKDG